MKNIIPIRKVLLTNVLLVLGILFTQNAFSQKRTVNIGVCSDKNCEIALVLKARLQNYNPQPTVKEDIYDRAINSPKSALILERKIGDRNVKWLYVNNLEGGTTTVYDLNHDFAKVGTIRHFFSPKDSALFHETDFPGYTFKTRKDSLNIFMGRPVEMCISNNGKYLWIPYYRRDYDPMAIDPSAIALIDVDKNKIIRVFPAAPLPKMITCSPDNKYIAVTNWGDNTVHLIDISSGDPDKFQYAAHFVVDQKLNLDTTINVDRDAECGLCLRGTVFTPDSKYLLVGRMSGGGIAFFDVQAKRYIRSVFGMKTNVRHLIISGQYLYLSSNKDGVVQRTHWQALLAFAKNKTNGRTYSKWETVFTGTGARTITITPDQAYVFATANNESKVSIVRTSDMVKVNEVATDSYPVGMTIDNAGQCLVVTAQGRGDGGGNSVMIYDIIRK